MNAGSIAVVVLVVVARLAASPALAGKAPTETVTGVTPVGTKEGGASREPVAPTNRAGAKEPAAARDSGDGININTASVKELMTLSGIGRKVAERIVEYREAHGPFKRPEDIRKVEGVGGGLWEQNKARIVVK